MKRLLPLLFLLPAAAIAQVQIPQARNCPYTAKPSIISLGLTAGVNLNSSSSSDLQTWGEAFDDGLFGGSAGLRLILAGKKRVQLETGADFVQLNHQHVVPMSPDGAQTEPGLAEVTYSRSAQSVQVPAMLNIGFGRPRSHVLLTVGTSHVWSQLGATTKTETFEDGAVAMTNLDDATGFTSAGWVHRVGIGLGSQFGRYATFRFLPVFEVGHREDWDLGESVSGPGRVSVQVALIKHL